MYNGILSNKDITEIKTSIKTFLLTSIQLKMHIYFNNLKTNPDVAVSKDIKAIRRLIANYNDFITNMNNIPLKKLEYIRKYILIGELKLSYIITKIPYLSTEIEDDKFIELFDFIYEQYYTNFKSKVVEMHIKRRKNKSIDIYEQSVLKDKLR